jgi:hypothetical protein
LAYILMMRYCYHVEYHDQIIRYTTCQCL